jgi:hypothetical protein
MWSLAFWIVKFLYRWCCYIIFKSVNEFFSPVCKNKIVRWIFEICTFFIWKNTLVLLNKSSYTKFVIPIRGSKKLQNLLPYMYWSYMYWVQNLDFQAARNVCISWPLVEWLFGCMVDLQTTQKEGSVCKHTHPTLPMRGASNPNPQ